MLLDAGKSRNGWYLVRGALVLSPHGEDNTWRKACEDGEETEGPNSPFGKEPTVTMTNPLLANSPRGGHIQSQHCALARAPWLAFAFGSLRTKEEEVTEPRRVTWAWVVV